MLDFNSDGSLSCQSAETAALITSSTHLQDTNYGSGSTGYRTQTTITYAGVPASGKFYWRRARTADNANDGKLELVAATGLLLTGGGGGLEAAFNVQQALSGAGTHPFAVSGEVAYPNVVASMGFWASDAFIAACKAGTRTLDSGGAGEVWPEGNALYRAVNVTIMPNAANVDPATNINLSGGGVPAGAGPGTVVGTLSVDPSTAVGGSFRATAGSPILAVSGSQVVVAAGQTVPGTGPLSITIEYDNTDAGGGVFSQAKSVAVLSASATTTTIGRYTPVPNAGAGASPIPVPGTSDGTYGPFTVAGGLATWAAVPLTAGTYALGSHQIVVKATDTQTVAHIDDAYAVSKGGWDTNQRQIDLDQAAIRRSMSWLPVKSSLINIKTNPPAGITYDAGQKKVFVTPSFSGQTLFGYRIENATVEVQNGADDVTFEQCYCELTERDVHGTPVFQINGRNFQFIESVYDQPFDFGYPGAVFRHNASTPGYTSLIDRSWIGPHGGDFIKPHQQTQTTVIRDSYIGPGAASTGKMLYPYFGYQWEPGRTYKAGEYFKNPNEKPNQAGFFESKADGNLGNPIPTTPSSNTWWRWRDPHSDWAQAAILNSTLTIQGCIIDYQQRDITGYGPCSSSGFVNILRFINKQTSPGLTSCTVILEDTVALRRTFQGAVKRVMIEVLNNDTYWPNGFLTVRRCLLGPQDWDATNPQNSRSNYFTSSGVASPLAEWTSNICAATGKAIA